MKKLTAVLALALVSSALGSGGVSAAPTNFQATPVANQLSQQIQTRLVTDVNYLVDEGSTSTLVPGVSLSRAISNRLAFDSIGTNKYRTYPETKFEKAAIARKVSKLDGTWSSKNGIPQAWCAWTSRFLLRGTPVFKENASGDLPSAKDVNSTSYLIRLALANGGRVLYGPGANPGSVVISTQPGDLVAYYYIENKAAVQALLDKPTKGTKRPFEHLVTVVYQNVTLEGNRGAVGNLRLTGSTPKKFTDGSSGNKAAAIGYQGLVIVRPNWQ